MLNLFQTIYLYKHKTNNINKTVKNLFEQLFVYDVVIKYSWSGQTSFAKGKYCIMIVKLKQTLNLSTHHFHVFYRLIYKNFGLNVALLRW